VRQPTPRVGLAERKAKVRIEATHPEDKAIKAGTPALVLAGALAVEHQKAVVLSHKMPVGPEIRGEEERLEEPAGTSRLRAGYRP
jgi:hypothetical protein